MKGVILYGPPASGKDTITGELVSMNAAYRLFERYKHGAGRTIGYRSISESDLARLRSSDDIIWENSRYDSVYVIDRTSLESELAEHIPIIHLGQVAAVRAVVNDFPDAAWTVAALCCPRDIAIQRIRDRGTGDTEARVKAWDETIPLQHPDIAINTAQYSALNAARMIDKRVHG